MSTTKTINHRANGHATHRNIGVAEAQCPYCGQPITRKEFKEIRARIEGEEKARLVALETSLKARFAHEQQQTAMKAAAEVAKVKKDAAAQVEKAKREAAAGLAPKIAEAINTEKAKAFTEKLKLTEQLQDMQRRLEKRTAGELGDEAELDLYEALRQEFPGDDITRVPKGRNGADIVHKIIHGSAVAGVIIFESKNHKLYQHKWTAKAKQDQIAEQADHALIVTATFPTGHRELMVKDGVLVVSPGRVIAIATWLRAITLRTHSLKLTNQARLDKSARLYTFMTSDRVADRWNRMAQTMTRMRDGLRAERNAHEKAWSDRTDQVDVLVTIRDDFIQDLDSIFEATEEPSP